MGTVQGWETRRRNAKQEQHARDAAFHEAGVRDERERIYRELSDWANYFMRRGAYMDSFREALDKVCHKRPKRSRGQTPDRDLGG